MERYNEVVWQDIRENYLFRRGHPPQHIFDVSKFCTYVIRCIKCISYDNYAEIFT